jgi:phosphoglycolate phosphatase-like HAD superfamily hydrolase
MKLFVWDMNGVLERGCDRVTIDISNEVLNRFGYGHRFEYEHSHVLYGRTWSDYFAYLMPQEPPDRHQELQDACFAHSAAHPELLRRWMQPTPHAAAVLRDIAGAGHDQIVISNTRQATLETSLELLDIASFFAPDRAFAVDQGTGQAPATKPDLLATYLAGHPPFSELVIVGDSPGDMLLSQVAGGVTYLFAHPGFEFRECPADFRIRDLRQVLNHA